MGITAVGGHEFKSGMYMSRAGNVGGRSQKLRREKHPCGTAEKKIQMKRHSNSSAVLITLEVGDPGPRGQGRRVTGA